MAFCGNSCRPKKPKRQSPTNFNNTMPPQFPLEEIKSITNNFADSNFNGSEGFLGKSYRGSLSVSGELMDVAVRRLDHSFWLQDIAFDQEFAILSAFKHKNLVSNIGFCNENDEMLIINKHEANGNLHSHLSDPSTLTWMRRLRIAVGVAEVLSYLHGGTKRSIIHRNVNSRTILLDENWEAKLSGFEYSLMVPAGHHLYDKYQKLGVGRFTYKSDDIFSLGVVLFEILCGNEAFHSKDDNKSFEASQAIFQYENRRLKEFIDPDIYSQMDQHAFNIFSETACKCLKEQQTPLNINWVVKNLDKAFKVQQRNQNLVQSIIGRTLPDHLMLKLKNFEHMRIHLTDILLATENFASKNLIVSGGYGAVYKGKLHHADRGYCFADGENECEVAIKRIMDPEDEIAQEGFYAEIEMLNKCKHSNIITLLGFCDEGVLVYEYAPNKSLVDYLLYKNKNIHNDSWAQLVKICLGVAKGLSCLHTCEGNRREIVHRDIKSANILLGSNLDAKIGDFGLSTFLSINEEQNTLYSREILGTSVYMDPQYIKERKLKKEVDVYSFGVVLFEILTGRLAYDPVYFTKNNKSLVFQARHHFENKTIMEIVDPKIKEATVKTIFSSIKGPYQDSVDTFSKIGYECLAERQADRPTMEIVIKELQKAQFFQENRKDVFRISLENIQMATKNFSNDNLIGIGRFGVVYKGKVTDANGDTSNIFVRRLEMDYEDTLDAFSTELKILMKCKHENVIRLVGYCDEMNEKVIVYEYASNGSLDKNLKNASLTWVKRLKICIDIARGLDFLHGGALTEKEIIDTEIRSSNILLDSDMKAKIANFGLGLIRLSRYKSLSRIDTFKTITGTQGYIAPEISTSSHMSSKGSNIYSFGIVLFEIMLQRLSFGFLESDHNYLGPLIKLRYTKGELDELMFEGRTELIAPQSLSIFKRIAIQCLRHNTEEQPTAHEVLIQLQKALELQEKGMDIVKISYEDLKFATDNFSDENLIGREGFGNIYKGQLRHANKQKNIAAKQLDRRLGEGDHEFYQELEILLKFKHKNVIGLEGYCDEMGERIIVYEYASNGSLDRWLGNSSLTWRKRLEICIDIASGLDFLHGGFLRQEAVIHRDVKSSIVLLGEDWKAKISKFELSLISPINQEMDYVNEDSVAGTQGYVDPVSMETGKVSKASDIYSFGVVLFEILSGRLTCEMDYSLGPLAKHYFEVEKFNEIVFEDIKEHIDPQSLEIFAKIAIQCLHDDQKERPTTIQLLKQLKEALEFQEDYETWEPKLPSDYKEVIQLSKTPEICFTKKKEGLYKMFSEGILIQDGKMWFSVDDKRNRNVMISPTQFSYENQKSHKWRRIRKSRFQRVPMMLDISNLNIKIQTKARFLSADVVYGVFLVFKFSHPKKISSKPMYVNLRYIMGNEILHSFFAARRDKMWMTVELYRFCNHKDDGDIDVLLESFSRNYCGSGSIYVEGIECRAIDDMNLEKIDVQQVRRSHSNLGQMQHLPTDNKDLSGSSENSDEDEKLFQQSEVNRKKHHMLSAREVIYVSSNVKLLHIKPSKQSRFQEVIELQSQQVFRIKCKIENQMLSPDTDYICYLVFKLSEKCRGMHCPVKIRDLLDRNNKETGVLYFRSSNPWNLHDISQVPEQREDGWMEVNIWIFNSNSALNKEYVPLDLRLISYEGTMSGLIICGLEFRPL